MKHTPESLAHCRAARASRIQQRKDLRARGIKPTNRSVVYCVELEAIPVPGWARERAVRGMTLDSPAGVIWVRSRALARSLKRLDAAEGGDTKIIVHEMRRCPNCKRLLIGADAVAQRARLERFAGKLEPCDAHCVERQKFNKLAPEIQKGITDGYTRS